MLILIAGCSSVDYRNRYYGFKPGIYPGVRQLIDEESRGGFMTYPAYIEIPFKIAYFILDFPFSFVLDTICLPYDAFKNYEKKEIEVKEDNVNAILKNSTYFIPE